MPKLLDTDYEAYLGTATQILSVEGLTEAANLLRKAKPRVVETGYDNWNGGTTTWTIYLGVPPDEYARIGVRREALQDQITKRLKPVIEQYSDDWYTISIVPAVEPNAEWRETGVGVPREIRQNIFDGLRLDQVRWSGRLEEVEFLERLFDLKSLPSHDPRHKDAAGDIWRHRLNNPEDWADDWIYDDHRFGLLDGPSETFLRFLCEVLHPVVRPDRDETLKLAQHFNDQLRAAGWRLVEHEKIAGRPRYVAEQIQHSSGRSVSRARSVADALKAGWMQKAIERMENSVESDPALAIGTAKELVESCCKTILVRRGVTIPAGADLPTLTKTLAKELRLVPDDISEQTKGSEAIRAILRNLGSLTHNLAELRGLYGTGHGRHGEHRGLEPRHARLAVGAAVAFIDFVTDTYHRRDAKQAAADSAKAKQ